MMNDVLDTVHQLAAESKQSGRIQMVLDSQMKMARQKIARNKATQTCQQQTGMHLQKRVQESNVIANHRSAKRNRGNHRSGQIGYAD